MDSKSETVEQCSCSLTLLTWGITAVIGVGVLLYFLFKRDPRIQKYLDKFDGPLSLPILGSCYLFLRPKEEMVDFFISLCNKYRPTLKVWVGNTPYVALTGAAEVEKILSSTTHIEKSTDYNSLHKWLGLGLLTSKPPLWNIRRKALTPTFHFRILEEFMDIFNEQGNTLVEILKAEKNDGTDIINIFSHLTRCTLDIICETAMGKKVNTQRGQRLEYVDAVYGYGEMAVKKMMLPWLQNELIWKLLGYAKLERNYLAVLHNFTENVILTRKKERLVEKKEKLQQLPEPDAESNHKLIPKRRKAFLDVLLDMAENEHSLTDSEIREEVDTFMFEGHDTTAASMGWTMFLLSLYPEHQKKIQEELDEIFGSERDRDVTSADIARMTYLGLCIKESLRLYPSVPFNFRYLNQDLDLGEDRIIPKGTNVCITTFSLHMDPDVFPDPETFNPDRFLPENCVGRNPYAYVPFSAGPRNCIGQKFAMLEEKTVLAKLLINFNFESVKKREEVKMLPDIILRPVGGILVRITQRL